MALGIVSRWSWVPVVACIGLVQGCGSKNGDDDSGGGCSKDTDCINGRICENKQCVAPAGGILGGSSGAGGSSGTGGTGGTAAVCSDTDPATCPTTDSVRLCLGGTLQTLPCDYYCTTLGFPVGACMAPGGCACDFTMPTDSACATGASALCTCAAQTTQPCVSSDTEDDLSAIYVECHNNDTQAEADAVRCLGMQVMDNMINCSTAVTACQPPAQ